MKGSGDEFEMSDCDAVKSRSGSERGLNVFMRSFAI